MYSIRGATTIVKDEKNIVLDATKELLEKIIKENNVNIDDIVSIIFSCTKDIKSQYPAEGARQMGINRASLMCLQEMYVEGSLDKCIRILMLVNGDKSQKDVKHIYINGAQILRMDL